MPTADFEGLSLDKVGKIEYLIELLNEYGKERAKKYGKKPVDSWRIYGGKPHWEFWFNSWSYMVIISKEFGFIKWLVDNDKIDLEKLDEKSERKPQYTFIDDEGRLGFKLFEVYESLLMLLAIQENPIEFLCSVLK